MSNLPIIHSYKDLLEFNKSLGDKKYLTYNISGVKYAKNTIEVNGETVNIDRFLYDYIVNQSFILTGKIERLKQYDFSRLNYLLHPEFREEFVGKLRAYFNNVVMLGGSEVELWDFTLTIEGKDIILKRYNKARAEEVFIPSFITKIEGGAFYKVTTTNETYFKYLKKVTIEEGSQLKAIGDNAFYFCTALEEINLPEGLESIGANAFYKCNFISVLIPSSVKVIKERAFEYCRQLRQVVFKNNSRLKVLENNTFNGCLALEKINLSSSLEEIGTSTFRFCRSLEKINIPDSVKILGEFVFANCYKLKEVKIGKGVTAIPTHAFRHCDSLTKVTALGNIDIISTDAFDIKNIPKVYIPKTSKFEPSENDEEAYRDKIIKQ